MYPRQSPSSSIANMTSSSPSSPPLAPFRLSTTYHLLRQTNALVQQTLVQPLTAFVNALAFHHTSIITSIICLSLTLLLAYHSTWILPSLLLLTLRWMIWNYLYYRRFEGNPSVMDAEGQMVLLREAQLAATAAASSTAAHGSSRHRSGSTSSSGAFKSKAKHLMSSALDSLNPLNLFNKKSDAAVDEFIDDQPDIQTLDRILRPHLKAALSLVGLPTDETGQEKLTRYQQTWQSVMNQIQFVYDAARFKKSYETEGKLLALVLVAALVYCYYLPQVYLVLIVGSYILTRETVIGQNLTWMMLSAVQSLELFVEEPKTN